MSRRGAGRALVAGLALLSVGCDGEGSAPPAASVAIESGAYVVQVWGKGRVAPIEQSVVSCPQGFWGVKVASVAVEGTRVTTGDVVLEVDLQQHQDRANARRRQAERARLRFEELRATQARDLSNSETNLLKKQLSLESSREKLEVLLRGPRNEKVEAQELALEAGEALAVNKQRKLTLEERLRDRGFTSELAFLDVKGELEKAELRRDAAAAELRRLQGGPRQEERGKLEAEERMITLETQQTERAHENKEQIQKLAAEEKRLDVETKKGQLRRVEKRLARGNVQAPASGVILHSLYGVPGNQVDQGETLWSNQEVLRVVRLDRFKVELRIGERDVDAVELGAAVEVELPAIPDRVFVGAVTKVGKFAVPAVGGGSDGPKEFEVEVELRGGADQLKPNLSARVGVAVKRLERAFRVRHDAVLRADEQAVLLLESGQELRLTPVAEDEAWLYFEGEAPAARVLIPLEPVRAIDGAEGET